MDLVKPSEASIDFDPGSGAFTALADEFCSRGLWAEAVRECRQGLTFQPEHLRGRVLLGWALKELGKWDEAERVLKAVAEEIQKNALLFSLLAEIAEKGGDMRRAELYLDIGQNLRATALEQPALSEVKPDAELAVESRRSSAMALLTFFLEGLEAKPIATAATPILFSAEDRAALAQILKSRAR
jgi:predicted Zn-dependent protease